MGNAGGLSGLADLANNAVVSLAGQWALIVVMSLVAWLATRSLRLLDAMAKDIHLLSKNVAVVMEQIDEHERRIEKMENRVFQ